MTSQTISMQEVAKHNTYDDCWIVIYDKVYNVTSFLSQHPGGISIIADHAGKLMTEMFETIHSKAMLATLPKECFIGIIDETTIDPSKDIAIVVNEQQLRRASIPSIDNLLNIYDFKAAASKVMSKQGWNYYVCGAEDEITLRENQEVFSRVWFRPRVLVDISKLNMESTILGYKTSVPIYITGTALAKLAHIDGEVALTRAAYTENIIQMIPTLSSCSMDEICQAANPKQIQFLQLYVNLDRNLTREVIVKAIKYNVKALCLTVDAPIMGRRERDLRMKTLALSNAPNIQKENFSKKYEKRVSSNKSGGGVASALGAFIDPSLNWNDIQWMRDCISSAGSDMKIVLKGIQCGEDAVLAVEHGVHSIICSNHGGRQLDYSRSGLEVLVEVMEYLEMNDMKDRIEVWMDGGIRRGTDIFKALALGAKCVGIGRPTLYGLACYGQQGVERVIQLLKNELMVTMKLMGCQRISDIKKSMVIYDQITVHCKNAPENMNRRAVYGPVRLSNKFNSKL